MKVKVTYTETWNRVAVVDIDEDEVREWASIPEGEKVTGKMVQEFFEATEWDRVTDSGQPPWVTQDPTSHPGERSGDEFYESDLDSVEVVEDLTAFALVAGFRPSAPVRHHLGRTPYVDSDSPVVMFCGVTAVIPDRPVTISSIEPSLCVPCITFQRMHSRLLAEGKPAELADNVLPKVKP